MRARVRSSASQSFADVLKDQAHIWQGGESVVRWRGRYEEGRARTARRGPLYFFLRRFCCFLYPVSSFLYPPPPPKLFSTPPQFFSTYPILLRLERVLYAAVTYTLSGCMNVLCNRPIPAQPPMHPARLPSTRVTAAWEGRGCERGLSTARERRHRNVRGASTRA